MWSVFQVCPITLTTKAFTGNPHAGSTPEFSLPEMFLPYEHGSRKLFCFKLYSQSNNNCWVKVQYSCLKYLVFESETSRKRRYVVQIPEQVAHRLALEATR